MSTVKANQLLAQVRHHTLIKVAKSAHNHIIVTCADYSRVIDVFHSGQLLFGAWCVPQQMFLTLPGLAHL
jgi:hypothetical protein